MASSRTEQCAVIKEEEEAEALSAKVEPASIAELEAADDFINFDEDEVPPAEAAATLPVSRKRNLDDVSVNIKGQKRQKIII